MRKGRHAWLPSIMVGEIEDLSREESIDDFSVACREFAKYAKIGREVKRMMNFDFKNVLGFSKKR